MADNNRKRVVVEEVSTSETPAATEVVEAGASLTEAKEKVEELQTITEHMSGDLEKSVDVQEDLAKAVEEAAPVKPDENKTPDFGPVPESQSSNPLWIIVPGIFLLGALLGGIIFYQKSLNKNGTQAPTPTPSSEASPAPSSSPSASVDLTKYSIDVKNGSGIAGEASNVSNILTTAGFKVSKTGNADSYDFIKTIIQAKSSVSGDFISALSKTLAKTYTMDSNETLSDTSSDDVVVIVGSSKAQ